MLIRHSFLYVVARILPGLLGMVTTAILTRLLDVRGYGLYGLALVIMTFVSTMGFEWLGISFVRFNEGRQDDERMVATFVHMFFAVMVLSALLVALAWVLGLFSAALAPVYLLGILLAWSYSWFELAARLETANMRPMRYLGMNLGRAGLILLGAAGAGWLTRDPVWTTVGTGLGMLGGAMFGSLRQHRMAPRLFDGDLALKVIAFGLPMAISMTLTGVITSGTRALVQFLDSSEALGLYTAAFVLVQNSLAIMASGIAAAGYPLAVRAVESGDPMRARRQLLANGTLLLTVLAPACLGMALTAEGISTTLVGPKFSAGVAAITPWMAAGTFFAGFRAHYLDHAFQLGRRPSLQIWVTCVAAIVATAFSCYLIPREGPVGAAIAVTIAMAVSCCHAVVAGRSAYPIPFPVGAAPRVALGCALMAVAVHAVPGRGLRSLLLQVAVGILAYGAAALALNLLDLRSRAVEFLSSRPWRREVPVQGVDV